MQSTYEGSRLWCNDALRTAEEPEKEGESGHDERTTASVGGRDRPPSISTPEYNTRVGVARGQGDATVVGSSQAA